MPHTQSTKRAIAKYGREFCLEAYNLNRSGEGASTIACYLSLPGMRQADAAINAGRAIVEMEGK